LRPSSELADDRRDERCPDRRLFWRREVRGRRRAGPPGQVAIDSDDDPFLARFVDPAGDVVAEAPATLYVCGGADNQQEVADRFTQVFLLEIDEPTMLARLDARRDYHDWGRIGDTREYLRHKLPAVQGRLRASGAVPVDARQPLDQVVNAILSAISTANVG
jgi:hypothetical protein